MLKAINDGAHNCTRPATSSIFSSYACYYDNGAVWITVPHGVFINLLLNHGVRGLQGIYFFASAQVASAGCMCSVIVYFLHYICVCDCDGRHESIIMLSHSVMVRRSHLLAQCYLGTMCMCTTLGMRRSWA
jgi:hypothetical protein